MCADGHVARLRKRKCHAESAGHRDDVKKLFAALQRADHLRALAFQNTDDPFRFPPRRRRHDKNFSARRAHEHAVFVQRRSVALSEMAISFNVESYRLEKTFSSAIHADAAKESNPPRAAGCSDALDARGPRRIAPTFGGRPAIPAGGFGDSRSSRSSSGTVSPGRNLFGPNIG